MLSDSVYDYYIHEREAHILQKTTVPLKRVLKSEIIGVDVALESNPGAARVTLCCPEAQKG